MWQTSLRRPNAQGQCRAPQRTSSNLARPRMEPLQVQEELWQAAVDLRCVSKHRSYWPYIQQHTYLAFQGVSDGKRCRGLESVCTRLLHAHYLVLCKCGSTRRSGGAPDCPRTAFKDKLVSHSQAILPGCRQRQDPQQLRPTPACCTSSHSSETISLQ